MEQLVLTTPVTRPTVTTWHIGRLVLATDPDPLIHIHLIGSDGTHADMAYEGNLALTLIRALNTANLATKSLQRRVLERLIADYPHLAGSVGGTPD